MKFLRRRTSCSSTPARNRRVAIQPLEQRCVLTGLLVTTELDVVSPTDNLNSLREAIEFANSQLGPDIITFDSGVFGTTAQVIELTGGTLTITEELTIDGPGADLLAVDGLGAVTVFVFDPIGIPTDPELEGELLQPGDLNIEDVTVDNGFDDQGSAGGIDFRSLGTLTLTNSVVSGSTGYAGGVRNTQGSTVIANSTVSGNTGDLAGGILTYNGLSITDSIVSGNVADSVSSAGGIWVSGTLTLMNSTVSGNTATGNYSAGGIYNENIINDGGGGYGGGGEGYVALEAAYESMVVNSTISGNVGNGQYAAGGLYADDLTLVSSTVSGNDGVGVHSVGGIYASNVTLKSSTVSGNTATGDASTGGIYTSSDLKVINSTVSGNTGSGAYSTGGIWVNGFLPERVPVEDAPVANEVINFYGAELLLSNSTVTGNDGIGSDAAGGVRLGLPTTIQNSIVANNTAIDFPDLAIQGPLFLFASLVGDTTGTFLGDGPIGDGPIGDGEIIGDGPIDNGNLFDIDPLLGPLADNGGPTETHALMSTSPAIDAGENEVAVDEMGSPLIFDQRGIGFPRVENFTVDMGAFEAPSSGGNTPPVITSDGGGATATVSIPENSNYVTNVDATDDVDAEGSGLTFSFTTDDGGGTDNGLFTLDPNTGELMFAFSPPDFENPQDEGGISGDNLYEVQVTVTDSLGATDSQDITVEVLDVTNGAPVWKASLADEEIDIIETETTIDVVLNGVTTSYQLADIATLEVRALNGDDIVRRLGGTTFTVLVKGGNGNDILEGNGAIDHFFGNSGRDLIKGGGGDDFIDGGIGFDTLRGGNGNDTIVGNKGNDRIFGQNGNDILSGNEGTDIVVGGNGDDTLSGEGQADVLIGGAGLDILNGDNDGDLLIGAATTVDNISAQLDLIMAEWKSANGYNARVSNLFDGSGTTGGGTNGTLYLPGIIVADTDVDQLTGGASRDYFWALPSEVVDLESNELTDV